MTNTTTHTEGRGRTKAQPKDSRPTRRVVSRRVANKGVRKQALAHQPSADRGSANPPTANERAPRRRGAWRLWTVAPIAAVVIVVAALVAVALGSGSRTPSASRIGSGAASASSTTTVPVPAAVESEATSVRVSTLRAVGVPRGLAEPTRIAGTQAPLVGPDGKPEVLYVGAEFCPYCAAERWALVVALSHFGRFAALSATHSSSRDVYPNTPTFSFYGSSYTSTQLDFQAVELESNRVVGGRYSTLQRLTAQQQAVVDAYDRAPYSSVPGSIPFIDIGNHFVLVGASYDPGVLQGASMAQIAAVLSQPNSAIARAVDRSANILVSAIANATGIQPFR